MDVDARKATEEEADAENIVAVFKDNSPLIARPGRSTAAHLLLIGSAVLVTYFGIWRAYFWTDDFWMLGWVRHQPSLADAVWAQFGYAVRFLLDAHLWLRMYMFDMDPAPYYLLSLGQHLLVAFLVYALVRAATSRNGLALLTAILFATTYAHFTVVTWITGSEYSQAALFYLTTLGAFAAYLETRRTGWLMASLTAFVALLLYLEVALSVPLVLIAYHLTVGRAGRSGHSRRASFSSTCPISPCLPSIWPCRRRSCSRAPPRRAWPQWDTALGGTWSRTSTTWRTSSCRRRCPTS